MKKLSAAFMLSELLIVLAVLGILTIIALAYLNPAENQARARDGSRQSDISTLKRAIENFFLENSRMPDAAATGGNVRRSDQARSDHEPFESTGSGWIRADLSPFLTRLPVDPQTFNYYRYTQNGQTFELDAIMEVDRSRAQGDGGNNSLRFEAGSNLALLD